MTRAFVIFAIGFFAMPAVGMAAPVTNANAAIQIGRDAVLAKYGPKLVKEVEPFWSIYVKGNWLVSAGNQECVDYCGPRLSIQVTVSAKSGRVLAIKLARD
jgi:hypothetical protein